MASETSRDDSVVEFYGHVRRAAIDALKVIRDWKEEGNFFLHRHSFPEVSYGETGLPWFGEKAGVFKQSPTEWDYPFSALADRVELPDSWKDLWVFVQEDERLRQFFDVEKFDFGEEERFPFRSMAQFTVTHKLRQLLDHYIHTTELKRYRKRKFLPYFIRWANACYPEELFVRFVVPIALVDIEVEGSAELTEGVSVERMPEPLQLGRALNKDQGATVNRRVVAGATHALVLSNWTLPNQSLWDRNLIPTDLSALEAVVEQVERFFGALRTVAGCDTGYGQIVTQPHGWCDRWAAHIEEPYVLHVREYPERIESRQRNEPRPFVSRAELDKVAEIFMALQRSGSNRLNIAYKRLNAAYLRREEADSVIDICIGLESLFVGDDRGETTHKLATRLGAAWSLAPAMDLSPYQAFRAAKDIYEYRSAVVHGSRRAEKKRVIRPRPDIEIEAVTLGLNLLRHSLQILGSRPELLKDGSLDEMLLDPSGPVDS